MCSMSLRTNGENHISYIFISFQGKLLPAFETKSFIFIFSIFYFLTSSFCLNWSIWGSSSPQPPSCWLKRRTSWKKLMKEKGCGWGCFRKSFLPSNDFRIFNHQLKNHANAMVWQRSFKEQFPSHTSILLINWKIRNGKYQTHLLIIKWKKSPFS